MNDKEKVDDYVGSGEDVRYFYFYRQLYKVSKDINPWLFYRHNHFGIVVAAACLDKKTRKIKIGFSFCRPKYELNKKFFRGLAKDRAFSKKGIEFDFTGNSMKHVIDAFDNHYPSDRKPGFARKMSLAMVVKERKESNMTILNPFAP